MDTWMKTGLLKAFGATATAVYAVAACWSSFKVGTIDALAIYNSGS